MLLTTATYNIRVTSTLAFSAAINPIGTDRRERQRTWGASVACFGLPRPASSVAFRRPTDTVTGPCCSATLVFLALAGVLWFCVGKSLLPTSPGLQSEVLDVFIFRGAGPFASRKQNLRRGAKPHTFQRLARTAPGASPASFNRGCARFSIASQGHLLPLSAQRRVDRQLHERRRSERVLRLRIARRQIMELRQLLG